MVAAFYSAPVFFLRELLRHGADLFAKNDDDDDALLYAMMAPHLNNSITSAADKRAILAFLLNVHEAGTYKKYVNEPRKRLLVLLKLCERGRDVKVTDRNKRTYVDALWRHHVLEAHKDATWHLAKGVYSVLPPDLLAVFDAYELELLMCGSPTIDVADWAKHTEYAGEYRRRGDRHAVIAWFWKAVAKLDDADHAMRDMGL